MDLNVNGVDTNGFFPSSENILYGLICCINYDEGHITTSNYVPPGRTHLVSFPIFLST